MLHGKKIDPKRAKARMDGGVRKVFVGGLDPSTPEDEIREYFSRFGKVSELYYGMYGLKLYIFDIILLIFLYSILQYCYSSQLENFSK